MFVKMTVWCIICIAYITYYTRWWCDAYTRNYNLMSSLNAIAVLAVNDKGTMLMMILLRRRMFLTMLLMLIITTMMMMTAVIMIMMTMMMMTKVAIVQGRHHWQTNPTRRCGCPLSALNLIFANAFIWSGGSSSSSSSLTSSSTKEVIILRLNLNPLWWLSVKAERESEIGNWSSFCLFSVLFIHNHLISVNIIWWLCAPSICQSIRHASTATVD